MPSQSETLSFWHMALAEPLGIYLLTPDVPGLKSILYSARAKANDPSLAHLQIRTAPPDPEPGREYVGLGPRAAIWIVNPPQES